MLLLCKNKHVFLKDSIALNSLLLSLPHRCSGVSGGNVENLQLRLRSPLRDPFFDPSPPFFLVLFQTLGTTGLDQLTNRCVKLRLQVGLFLNSLQSRFIIDCGFVFANTQPVSHFAYP